MIGKISTGNNFKGLLEYLIKEDSEILDKTLLNESIDGMATEFMMVSQMNSKVEKPVRHFVLSFSKDDEKVINDKFLTKIAKEYLEEMGYDQNQYIMVKHNDTDKLHVHLAVNRVGFDMKCVPDSFEKMKSRAFCVDLEKRYNLSITAEAGKGKDGFKSIGKLYQEKRIEKESELFKLNPKGEKIGFTEEGRSKLSKLIYATVKSGQIRSFEELGLKLAEEQIDLKSKNQDNVVVFGYDGVEINGGALYRNLSYSQINQELRKNVLKALKKNIDSALREKPKGRDDFFKTLENSGIQIQMNSSKTGYSFLMHDQKFKASSVDRKLTFSRIDETLQGYVKKAARTYIGDSIYQFLKKDTGPDFIGFLKEKEILLHKGEPGNSKFYFDGVVVPEKELGGIVARHGIDKVFLINEIQHYVKKLLADGVDLRNFETEMHQVSQVKVDRKDGFNFTKDAISVHESDFFKVDLSSNLERNFIWNMVYEGIDHSVNLGVFSDYLDAQGIQIRSDGERFTYEFEGKEFDMGRESSVDFVDSQLNEIEPQQEMKPSSHILQKGLNKGEDSDQEEDEIKRRNKMKGNGIGY